MDKVFHSVYLDRDKCLGCTTCIRSCPTGAIRVRGGKAQITETKCIDCGECIRLCPHHAKKAKTDPLISIRDFAYKVALPAPSLLGQFKLRYSIPRILAGLRDLGFDEVVEVAEGAELVGQSLEYELREGNYPKPLISSACPVTVNLIQTRFPEMTENINRLLAPMELTAKLTRRRIFEERRIPNEEIGIFFITPCPAKATEVKNVDGGDELSLINGAIAFKDIYNDLLRKMKTAEVDEGGHYATADGYSWAVAGGESKYLNNHRVLHVDGIASVFRVLDEMDNGKLDTVDFFEGLACRGGCVGGCLTVENNFIAKMNLEDRAAQEEMDAGTKWEAEAVRALYDSGTMHRKEAFLPRKSTPLDEDIGRAIEKMNAIEALEKRLPGLDCGSCGAPKCRALAEDIVMGNANEVDCVFILQDRVLELSKLTNELLQVGQPTGKYLDEEKKHEGK